ncbi:MAG: hypothetical protein SGARI_007628, partial [Bacillariaceae sp.]
MKPLLESSSAMLQIVTSRRRGTLRLRLCINIQFGAPSNIIKGLLSSPRGEDRLKTSEAESFTKSCGAFSACTVSLRYFRIWRSR